ncbi:MAG: hypothetical protein QOJ59_1918 [Thermomicrobiales bacterium]|jgi:hypothetical protein|nr:hypothetical protein [Thermomicrobiales bacterium]
MSSLRIRVDFNTMAMHPERKVFIPPQSDEAILSSLEPGMVVVLFEEGLEVDAVVEWDDDDGHWWGSPIPDRYRYPPVT